MRVKKRLGQHFLYDPRVINRIVQVAGVCEEDSVLEIGPGKGILTRALARKARAVLAVEIDEDLVQRLRQQFHDQPHVKIVQGDILKLDLEDIVATYLPEATTLKMVSNLPYYITSAIFRQIWSSKVFFESITVTVQKEVAERLVAEPSIKAYGVLSLIAQHYSEGRIVASVPRKCFRPVPEVDSAIVHLESKRHRALNPEEEACFFLLVKAAFGHRRKTLLNALSAEPKLGMDREELARWLDGIGIDGTKRRGESLSLKEYSLLARDLANRGRKPF